MPPSGVKKGSKRARQYEHIKDSERERGVSERRAEEIAARTVNKERARSGESRSSSRDVHERHLLRPARRPALRAARSAWAHPRAALPGGAQAWRAGTLVHEQGPAAARRRRQEALGASHAPGAPREHVEQREDEPQNAHEHQD